MFERMFYSFNLVHYLVPPRNANISSFRSRSTSFPDSRCCYSRGLVHVAFFETVACTVAIDVARSSVLDCELARA